MPGEPADQALPYPGDDPDHVGLLSSDLGTGRDRLLTMAERIRTALTALSRSWQGANAEAARAEVIVLSDAGRRLADLAGDAVRAVDSYLNELLVIRGRVDTIRSAWDAAGLSTIWLLGPDGSPTTTSPWAQQFSSDQALLIDPSGAAEMERRSAELKAQWQIVVQDQETAAAGCRTALEAAIGSAGSPGGTDGVRAELGIAIGLPDLVFDDRYRTTYVDGIGAATEWATLTQEERAYYGALGQHEYTDVVMPGNPADAADRWNRLDPMTQQALINADPAAIGHTDGLPVVARDSANRLLIPAERAAIQAELDRLIENGPPSGGARVPVGRRTEPWQEAVDVATGKLNALDAIAAGPDIGDGRPAYLLDINSTGSGRIALAIGNPDTADSVVTLVTGAGSGVSGVIGDSSRTWAMIDQAEQAGAGTVAGVTWTDYPVPQGLWSAAHDDSAVDGAAGLDRYLDGLRASHEGDTPFRSTVVAHSYGTLLTAKAASGDNSLNADALVFVASPGTDVDSVQHLRLDGVPADEMRNHVFATASDADLVADTPGFIHSDDPTHPDFGATDFPSPAHHGWWYYGDDHGRYWDAGSAPLQAMGNIIAGRPPG